MSLQVFLYGSTVSLEITVERRGYPWFSMSSLPSCFVSPTGLITVLTPSSISSVYLNGYYGKGGLSRSGPEHNNEEYLHLSMEETFYLCRKKMLNVYYFRPPAASGWSEIEESENYVVEYSTLLNPKQVFDLFAGISKPFVVNFLAYHYFRKLGWIPKSGLRFGTDFLLYSDHPSKAHSLYSIIIQGPNSRTDLNSSWIQLLQAMRVSNTVSKGLLICYVRFDAEIVTDFEALIQSAEINCVEAQNLNMELTLSKPRKET